MSFEIKKKHQALVVRVRGELDMLMAGQLRTALDQVLKEETPPRLVFNLEKVSFIDSSGLGLILGRYKQFAQWGGQVFIVGAGPAVKKVLELSGVLKIIPIVAAEKEALG